MCFDLTDCWADVKIVLVWVLEQILVISSQRKSASRLIDRDGFVVKVNQVGSQVKEC